MIQTLRPKGKFKIVCKDKKGKVKWTDYIDNAIVNQGLNRILDTMFFAKTQIVAATWRIGLIDNSPAPTLAAGDTHASHAGWSEAVGYSEATRPAWGHGASAVQIMTNAAAVVFSITGTATIHGLFVASVSVKGSTTGGANDIIWATGQFSQGNKAVTSGDTLNITYTVTAQNG